MTSISQIAAYGIAPSAQSAPQGPVAAYPIPSSTGVASAGPGMQVAPASPTGDPNDNAPTVAWIGVLAAFVVIRLLHDKAGARLE